MSKRQNISSGSKWEDIIGYSRAVRIGNVIEISGTTNGDSADPYEQTKAVLQKVQDVLAEAGAAMKDVVRTTIYVKDITKWEEIARAHGEFFKDIKPATTIVEVSALIDPNLHVEIATTAIISA